MIEVPVIASLIQVVANITSLDLVHGLWTNAVMKRLIRERFSIEQQKELSHGYRPDLTVKTPEGKTYIIEIKRNILAADIIRLASTLRDAQLENANGVILTTEELPSGIEQLGQEMGVAVLSTKDIVRGGMTMYKCPVCGKVANSAMNLARHVMAVADEDHITWMESRNVSFLRALGVERAKLEKGTYKELSDLLEKQAKM